MGATEPTYIVTALSFAIQRRGMGPTISLGGGEATGLKEMARIIAADMGVKLNDTDAINLGFFFGDKLDPVIGDAKNYTGTVEISASEIRGAMQ